MTIAKRIPSENESVAGPRSQVASVYGLSVEEFNAAYQDFVENEGFDGDGNEYQNLHEWLTFPHNTRQDNTPYQNISCLSYRVPHEDLNWKFEI